MDFPKSEIIRNIICQYSLLFNQDVEIQEFVLPWDIPVRNKMYDLYSWATQHKEKNKVRITKLWQIAIRKNGDRITLFLKSPHHSKLDEQRLMYKLGEDPERIKYKNAIKAFRADIHYQIMGFRKRSDPVCALTHKTKNLTVDHFPYRFSAILSMFLHSQCIYRTSGKSPNIREIQTEMDKKTGYRTLVDKRLKECWKLFHAKYAAFRWLDKDVHTLYNRHQNVLDNLVRKISLNNNIVVDKNESSNRGNREE